MNVVTCSKTGHKCIHMTILLITGTNALDGQITVRCYMKYLSSLVCVPNEPNSQLIHCIVYAATK